MTQDATPERIKSIEFSIRYDDKGTIPWASGEVTINGADIATATAPSWHGVLDDLNEAFHDAVWGEDDSDIPGRYK